MWARATALSRGLAARLEPSDGRIVVGVMTRNRPEWIVTDLAILERGYVSVALAPDDSDDRLAQIFALAKPTCVVVEAHNAERVTRLATTATVVVVLDGAPAGDKQIAFDALVADDDTPAPAARNEDELYAVLFTSGSTGMPKGAMRTYRTFNAMITSYAIGHSPRHLSFQPLSHLSERMYMPAILVNGGCIAFSQGGAHLLEELAILEPTTVGSVPRLWEVLHATYARRVRASTNPGDDEPRILAETRAQLGTRLLAVSVGSAPCSAEVLAFLRRCFADVWVSEGYGTTELGTIAVDGVIAQDVAVKLVPLPEAPSSKVERGEIWVKSPHAIAGYLGEATTTVDAEGFVATGDLGERDVDGRVRIVGRVRNTIKLAQGEFVSIDRVEAILASCAAIDRIFVHASYGAPHLAAVVVPRATDVDLAAALRTHGRAAGLAAYEVPAEIMIETEPFSVENGLLTASGKLARAALVAKYGARLGATTRPTIAELSSRELGADVLAARIARIASGIAKRPIAVDEHLGAGIGVDSLAAAEILEAISDDLGREVPLGWWFEARTLADLAARLTSSTAGVGANEASPSGVGANEALARADLELPPQKIASRAKRPVRLVLLTGATGFLGSFLVEALAAHDIHSLCLVRAHSTADAQRRLDAALAKRAIDVRATAIVGDLASPSTAVDIELAIDEGIDAVVHAGATVSWLASYEALRAPNVRGTRELLEYAAWCGAPFHHVSTISTAPPDGDEASSLSFEQAVASTPYALSKWVAEQQVRRAGDAVSIYRPAMIAADSVRGIGNAEDYLNRYL
ncbi:MAG: AMP-binding protein, partial [Deltaproteobacteria bacterium]|nr:AMP-binding protein [Deltaproteobacteria bacterium]